ncbi:MAG: hypothetical protein ACXVH3_35375 [Solirubrobacteraceae bacterium]
MLATVITASVAVLGLVIGWFVIGTQRVTEELTKERREAYLKLVVKADELHDTWGTRQRETSADPNPGSQHNLADGDATELSRLASAAEFLSSDEMMRSCVMHRFVHSAIDGPRDEFQKARRRFVDAARLDAHWNSRLRRKRAKGTKYKP